MNLIARVNFGHIIVVAGKTSINCKKFKVRLTDETDHVLTISVDLKTNEIVLDSLLSTKLSESSTVTNFTIKPGDPFKFYIFAAENQFHISLNGEPLITYKYRLPLFKIKCVQVSGDLEKVTQVDHRKVFPTAWPPIQEDLESIAFSSDVPEQFTPGSVIVLKMIVTGATDGSFFIRFNDSGSTKQLFHFNPRFGERVVAVNCMNDSRE